MPDSMVSEGQESSASTGESQGQSGGNVSSESLVTPEIQAKFDQVFGGKEPAADREAGKGPATPAKGKAQPTAQKPPAKQRKPFFDGTDDEGGEPDNLPAHRQEPQQPKTPEPPNSTENRSRVGNQPPNQQQGQQGQQQVQEGDDTPTLNPVLRQAALRAKWEPEVIEQLWAENPELAEKTFAQLHRSQNELSARFAQFGQHGQPVQQPQQQPNPYNPPAPRGQSINPSAPVNPADPQALSQLMAEVYGGQEQFTKLNSDWNNAIPQLIQPFVERVILPIQQQLQGAMNFIAGQERQNIAKEAGMWFDGIKKDFGEMYGVGTTTPSQEQLQAKRALTVTADQIRTGARMQGVQMTVSEALERAHLMLAADHYQVVERNRITAQIKKRSASITARPTQRKTPAVAATGGEGQKTLEGAQAAYAAKAAELGIEV